MADRILTIAALAALVLRPAPSSRPWPAQFEALADDPGNTRYLDFFDDDYVCLTGHYVLLYENGVPTETGFWGWSGD